ncbi:MAG: caspase family protein [Oligoflexia bacterium]|nr:caspase family protein [Oligoflexia bacterium]
MAKNCSSCEADANVMNSLFKNNGFKTYKFIDPNSGDVLNYIRAIAQNLNPNDYFVFYYSGHGSQTSDRNGDESDGLDETMLLNDREIIDDELAASFSYFNSGVKVLFLSDSCNSGTVYKDNDNNNNNPFNLSTIMDIDDIKSSIRAEFVAITSSRDDQSSLMGNPYSHFTNIIVNIWNNGRFSGSIRQFFQMINNQSTAQQPQYYSTGNNVNLFENERPFTIR